MHVLSSRSAVAVYSAVVGFFMLSFWAMLLLTDQVPAEQVPWAIAFHLAGELLTAVLLIVSALGLLLEKQWARILSPAALGMLLYTVIVSPGYYAQLGNTPMVIMFAILIVLTVAALVGTLKALKS
jgi:peptidoglycan/LPS O-acetylase OafA/YrhL